MKERLTLQKILEIPDNGVDDDGNGFVDDVSGWDVSNVTNMGNAFSGTAMTQANYDALLIAWSAQTVQQNVQFGISAQYTAGGAAEAARNVLINTYNWSISDGGPN